MAWHDRLICINMTYVRVYNFCELVLASRIAKKYLSISIPPVTIGTKGERADYVRVCCCCWCCSSQILRPTYVYFMGHNVDFDMNTPYKNVPR